MFFYICIFTFAFHLSDTFIISSLVKRFLTPKTVRTQPHTEVLTVEEKYNLNWYVIGEDSSFIKNKLYNIKVWGNNYVVWKDNSNYFALDDACSHRGASLSLGRICNKNVMCPYHGYEFSPTGTLVKVPGLNFTNTQVHNQKYYNVIEQDGWVYLNTVNNLFYTPQKINIYREPESFSNNFSKILLNFEFNAFGRLISENSLDVMHIGFVHTFGNKKNPSPTKEIPPYNTNDYANHYKTEYEYNSGTDSIAKKIFRFNKLKIENEFVLPHTTIARVIFGNYTSTVITNTLPLNLTHSKLFVKTYRNFWNTNSTTILDYFHNWIGDTITKITMTNTVLQDKQIVENINSEFMDGKFNMKYDKLQNVYKSLYKKYIFNVTKIH